MSQVLKLAEYKPHANEDAIVILTKALEEAIAGDLSAVTVVAARRGGDRLIGISDGCSFVEMIGLLERAKKLCNDALDAELDS
jgi:hypothetical protein